MGYRTEITFDCVLLAAWIFLLIDAFHHRDYGWCAFNAYFIGRTWKRIWETYDEAKGRK